MCGPYLNLPSPKHGFKKWSGTTSYLHTQLNTAEQSLIQLLAFPGAPPFSSVALSSNANARS